MRAVLLRQFGAPLTLEDLKAPDLGPTDVRVRIEASGVCHSDVTIASGAAPCPLPIVAGHEGAGTVLEVGANVTRVAVGDRVIAAFAPACGSCHFCTIGETNLCAGFADRRTAVRGRDREGAEVYGTGGLGTFADEMVTSEVMVVKVDTDLPSEQLALLGCGVTTGVGAALNTAQVRPGATVAVIGCGGVGQSVVQGARIAGASRILAIDPVLLKRTTAEQQGATDLVDPADGPVVEQVQAATGGLGVDYAFEVVGRPETILDAYGSARRGGTVVVVGLAAADATVTLSAVRLFAEAKTLVGSYYGSARVRADFPRFVRLVETGRLDVGSMVSRRIGLGDVNEAFTAMQQGEVIRSVVTDLS